MFFMNHIMGLTSIRHLMLSDAFAVCCFFIGRLIIDIILGEFHHMCEHLFVGSNSEQEPNYIGYAILQKKQTEAFSGMTMSN